MTPIRVYILPEQFGISVLVPEKERIAFRGNCKAVELSLLASCRIKIVILNSEAYFWLDLAAAGKPRHVKQEELAKYRDEAASHLSNTALLRTQERARKWFEDHTAKANPQ